MHLTFFPFSPAAFKAVSSLDAPTACLCMFGSLNESSQKNITKAQTEHVEALSIVWSFIKKIGNISSSVFQPAPEKNCMSSIKFFAEARNNKKMILFIKNLLYTSLSLCLSAFCHTGGRHGLALCLQCRALCLLQISRSRFSIIIGPDLLGLYRCEGGWKLTILASYNCCQRPLPGINTVSDPALQCCGAVEE